MFLPKAQQSRQKFLNEHMVKVDKDAIEEENGDEAEQAEEKDVSSSEIRKWQVKEVLFLLLRRKFPASCFPDSRAHIATGDDVRSL